MKTGTYAVVRLKEVKQGPNRNFIVVWQVPHDPVQWRALTSKMSETDAKELVRQLTSPDGKEPDERFNDYFLD